MDQMAQHHGVSRVTLHLWFHALGDEYKALRQTWIDNLLVEAGEKLEDENGDALSLARARELFKRACWYAERRDPFRYGAKGLDNQQVAVNVYVNRDGAMIDVTPQRQALEGDKS
jgi:hypothetical protein